MKSLIREFDQLAVIVEPAKFEFGIRNSDDAVLISGNMRDFTEPRYGSVEVWSLREFINQTS